MLHEKPLRRSTSDWLAKRDLNEEPRGLHDSLSFQVLEQGRIVSNVPLIRNLLAHVTEVRP